MSAFESRKFSWRRGYSYKVPADVVGGVLEDIEEKEGRVTGSLFLEYSRPEHSRTHGMFEWDDSVAAEKYRLSQAGKIISQLEVTYESLPEEMHKKDIRVSAFVNVSAKSVGEKGTYMNIVKAREDDVIWDRVVKNALSELRAFREKYSKISEFGEVFEIIREAERVLGDITKGDAV